MTPAVLYIVNAALSLAVVFLLGLAIALDWHNIRKVWKPALIAITIEQCVLAYANLEARDSQVPIEMRVTLLCLALIGVLISGLIAVVGIVHAHRSAPATSHRA